MIDTHLHLNNETNVEEFIQAAKNAGIEQLIVSCCSLEDIKYGVELINSYEEIYITVGFHPEVVNEVTEENLDYLQEVLGYKKVLGIGEIGLDYYWTKDNIDEQKEAFIKQLQLADTLKKPVVVHTRDALTDTYDILKDFNLNGVIHCYSGDFEYMNKFLELGYYFGIGGVVTFKNSSLKEVVKEMPIDRILLETDSPYLAPEPFRGKVNGSWNIKIIAEKIAEIKGLSLMEVASATTSNAYSLFDLD